MCDLNKEFKLCSCDGEKLPLEKADWILYRFNAALPYKLLRGMAAMSYFSGIEKNIRDILMTHLNEKNCFDFDYKPMPGDILFIKKIAKGGCHYYQFRYSAQKWIIDGSTGLDRPQHEFYKNGEISNCVKELFTEEATAMLEQKEDLNPNSETLKMLEELKKKISEELPPTE